VVLAGRDVIPTGSSVEALRSDGLKDRVGIAPHTFGSKQVDTTSEGGWSVMVIDNNIIDGNASCESDGLVDEIWDAFCCGKETARTRLGGGGNDLMCWLESAGTHAHEVDGNMFNIAHVSDQSAGE
jgi:hypothetical protein